VLLLATPDGHEGQSTLPPEDLPAGFPGAAVVSVGSLHVLALRLCLRLLPLNLTRPGPPAYTPACHDRLARWCSVGKHATQRITSGLLMPTSTACNQARPTAGSQVSSCRRLTVVSCAFGLTPSVVCAAVLKV
jgi:hypothetical protein